jgi:hypothetical protein
VLEVEEEEEQEQEEEACLDGYQKYQNKQEKKGCGDGERRDDLVDIENYVSLCGSPILL